MVGPRGIALVAVLLSACSSEPEAEFIYPTPSDYTDGLLPRAEATSDPDGFVQVGEDTGDTGIIYSAALGGYFLARVQQPDGSYKYEYDPEADEWIWVNVIHRQVGPAFAQALLYRYTGREEFRVSAERAFRYAEARVAEQATGSMLSDIGGTAIYLFGLTELARSTGTGDWDSLISELATYMRSNIAPDGTITRGGFISRGQVIQALMLLYHYSGDTTYLDDVARIGRHYWDAHDELPFDDMPYYALYASEALTDLYMVRPEPWIADYVFSMADALLDDQYTPENIEHSSWFGGFYRLKDSRPTWSATLRAESICDAFRLAQHIGDQSRIDTYRERILLSIAYQQRFQWRAGETDDFPNAQEPIGGYSYLMTNDLMRTDLVWHSTAMLLKAASYLELESFPGIADGLGTAPASSLR